MLKTTTALVLFVSFWWSCANTQQTSQNTPIISEKTTEPIPTDSSEASSISVSKTEEITAVAAQKNAAEKAKVSESKSIETQTVQSNKTPVIIVPEHTLWNNLLLKHVTENGDVNYSNFQNDAAILDEYLNYLAENSPKKEWSKNEKLAYYINLYNAATVKLILDNYPTHSIKDLKNPWGKSWVKTGDGILSLGDIEHKILRKMNEPRIHFAINCASFSCPKLLNKAYTSNQMEKQLQHATIDFINDTSRNKIDADNLELSNIFKWYKKDFATNGTLIDFIKPYSNITINPNAAIDYLDYNWNLNEAK